MTKPPEYTPPIAGTDFTPERLKSAIYSSGVKFRRAQKHVGELKPVTFFPRVPGGVYSNSIYFEEDLTETPAGYEFKLRATVTPVHPTVNAVFGDILTNLRASLDHLAYGMLLKEPRRTTLGSGSRSFLTIGGRLLDQGLDQGRHPEREGIPQEPASARQGRGKADAPARTAPANGQRR